jgi:hypothetical protein
MKRKLFKLSAKCTFLVVALTVTSAVMARTARADEASVSVGRVAQPDRPDRYAEPPPAGPFAYDDFEGRPELVRDRELYRAPFRLTLGPVGATTGHGLGLGLGAAADFGTGTVGFRLAGAWTRGEASAPSSTPIGDALSQYTGELTLDLHKHGPWHPMVAVGVGLAHVSKGDGSGDAGIGTGRVGLDYALFVEDADVRLGAGLLGALPGPADRELADLRAYAIVTATLSVGF